MKLTDAQRSHLEELLRDRPQWFKEKILNDIAAEERRDLGWWLLLMFASNYFSVSANALLFRLPDPRFSSKDERGQNDQNHRSHNCLIKDFISVLVVGCF